MEVPGHGLESWGPVIVYMDNIGHPPAAPHYAGSMTTNPHLRRTIEEDLRDKRAEREAVLRSIASRRRHALESPSPVPGVPDELSLSAVRVGRLDYDIIVRELALEHLEAAEPEPTEPVRWVEETPLCSPVNYHVVGVPPNLKVGDTVEYYGTTGPAMVRNEKPIFQFGPDGWKSAEDVENFEPSTSPTAPFDPSTAIAETSLTPSFSVEEALQDPLGIQLVENIHRRKALEEDTK